MRIIFASALLAFASAGKVHEFFAEQNYICSICEIAVEHAANGRDMELDQLYALFPALQARINNAKTDASKINLDNPRGTCNALELCAEESIMDLLMAEAPVDLSGHVEYVNNMNTTWTARANDKFTGASLKEIKSLMGTVVDPEWTLSAHKKVSTANATLPVNFDSRVNWPACEPVINHVRDQSNCGSCWAHGTTEALNDRTCIATGGKFQTLLSVSDTTGCCNGTACFSFGCNGGQVATPWAWFKKVGVVTGGDFGDNTQCYDYTMAKCAHHVTAPGLGSCDDIVQV